MLRTCVLVLPAALACAPPVHDLAAGACDVLDTAAGEADRLRHAAVQHLETALRQADGAANLAAGTLTEAQRALWRTFGDDALASQRTFDREIASARSACAAAAGARRIMDAVWVALSRRLSSRFDVVALGAATEPPTIPWQADGEALRGALVQLRAWQAEQGKRERDAVSACRRTAAEL